MLKRLLCAAVIASSLSTPTLAIDANGNYATFRNVSCALWIQGKQYDDPNALRLGLRGWVYGVLHGMNKFKFGKADWFPNVDPDGFLLFIDKYCSENPLKSVDDALTLIQKELEQ